MLKRVLTQRKHCIRITQHREHPGTVYVTSLLHCVNCLHTEQGCLNCVPQSNAAPPYFFTCTLFNDAYSVTQNV
jgi:hypothetical protein